MDKYFFNNGYDWKVTLRKAASHAFYAAFSILLIWASDAVTQVHIEGSSYAILIPLVQAGLKALVNWVQEHN